MKGNGKLLTAAGLGAGIMYLWDPLSGRRRRAVTREKIKSAASRTTETMEDAFRDSKRRLSGLRPIGREREGADDRVLGERVRSQLGRVVRHPSSIEVTVHEGRVSLSGPILADELESAIARISAVRGVREIDNSLAVHESPGDVPGLQGHPSPRGEQSEWAREYWMPAIRLWSGAAGAALVFSGRRQGGLLGLIMGGTGLTLLLRAGTNIPLRRVFGVGAGWRAVDIRKSINIESPVEAVYEAWVKYENFPHFMSNVREVRDLGEGRSHWTVAGPAGVPVEWDAVITRMIPNQILGWKTTPESVVQHAGNVAFQSNPDGSTRVDVQLSYNPGAGALGHTVAKLFMTDPKTQMDEDLMRMKTFVETGQAPRDAAQPFPSENR